MIRHLPRLSESGEAAAGRLVRLAGRQHLRGIRCRILWCGIPCGILRPAWLQRRCLTTAARALLPFKRRIPRPHLAITHPRSDWEPRRYPHTRPRDLRRDLWIASGCTAGGAWHAPDPQRAVVAGVVPRVSSEGSVPGGIRSTVGVAECVARDAEADTTGGGSPSKLAAAVTRTTGPCGPCPQGSWAAGWCGLAPLPEASHAHPAPSPLPPIPPLPPLSPPPPLPPYQSNNQPPCGLRLFCCVSVGRSDRLIFDPVSGARSDVRTDGDIPPASALRRRPLDRANKLHPSIASALTSAPPNAASVASPAPPTSPVENIPASG